MAPADYAVQKGDTLGQIAERFNLPSGDIRKANGLKNDKLQIGQVLIIPGSLKTESVHAAATVTNEKPAPAHTGVYTVVKGDTPGEIAEKLGVSPVELIKLNNLDSRKLRIGQRLTVPGYVRQRLHKAEDVASSGKRGTGRAETAEILSLPRHVPENTLREKATPGGSLRSS
jgi:membrane-bound lytic murein transglycosylase D